MILPLNKPCDLLGDAVALAPFYAQVDRYPDALAGQHPIRRWEYAMALYAIDAWDAPNFNQGAPFQICDVGGAGSNFWQVLTNLTNAPIKIIDPTATPLPIQEFDAAAPLHTYAGTVESYATLPHTQERVDVLTCISVIEHVQDLSPFFRACRMLLKPGGLLFLTTDYWDAEGEDTAHFNWMRERIYNADTIRRLNVRLRELGFKTFGTSAWSPYPGPQLYDYSIASLAMTRKAIP